MQEKVNTFLFGSKSNFNSLCLKKVTELKEKYNIKSNDDNFSKAEQIIQEKTATSSSQQSTTQTY